MPTIIHAGDCTKYSDNGKYFHEAGFDAFCVGFGELLLQALLVQYTNIINF